jgi:propanediol dehydratase large subunit
MEGFKPIFDDCQEKFGALDAGDESDLTVHLVNGDTIETNAIGVDFEDNVLRHFTWEELDESTIREAIEDEPVTFEEVLSDPDVELGTPFMMMNGMVPWDNVVNVELDTKGLF